MRKIIITGVIMIAAILAVSFAGCGGQEMEEEVSAEQENTGNGEAMTEAEQKPDAQQKKAADEISAETVAETEPVQLAGASFSVLGDSISTFRDYNPAGYAVFFPEFGEVREVGDTWWQMVADDLGMEIYANGSSSGATVSGDSEGTDDPRCACNELRTNDLGGPGGACPDRIIVYLGTNDMLEAVPLGENDGTSLVMMGEIETFSDAYTLMIDKLLANYPQAQIYCCTILHLGDYGKETPYVEFVNGAGLTVADYNRVIEEIAENKALSVIDLYRCGITVENLPEMTSDGVHPNVEGMKRIAEAVEEVLAHGN